MRVFGSMPLVLGLTLVCGGCTRESVRQALEVQQRANEIQQAVFDRQHDGLRVLLFRDLEARLSLAGVELSEPQQAVLNQAWNDRDLIEFWSVQQERSKALRVAGVDAKLYADQSLIDLLLKSADAKSDRARQGVAHELGKQATARSATEGPKAQEQAP